MISEQDPTSPDGKRTASVFSLKTAKLGVGLLLTFTAGCLFMSLVIPNRSIHKFVPKLYQGLGQGQGHNQGQCQGQCQEQGQSQSPAQQVVATLPAANGSSAAPAPGSLSFEAYLNSTRHYLRQFESYVVRTRLPSELMLEEVSKEASKGGERGPEAAPGGSRGGETKLLVWHNRPYYLGTKPSEHWFGKCPESRCQLSYDYAKDRGKADAVLFFGGPSEGRPERAFPGQIFVFFMMEPPFLTGQAFKSTPWNSAFNWTINYRLDADVFLPVGYLGPSPSVPPIQTLLDTARRKTKLVAWFASNCNVPSRRDEYVKAMQKVIPVDVYGRCGPLNSCPRDNGGDCDTKVNRMLNDDYKFYLSFENSMCQDYVTEKFYKLFRTDTHIVPVVRGGANYSRMFADGTYIDAERFSSPEELARHLQRLATDEARYVEMLWRKAHFQYREHGLMDAFCQLCHKVHHPQQFRHTIPDMYAWYHKDRCRPPRPFT